MITVEKRGGTAYFNVRVSPGSAQTKVAGEYDGAVKVYVSAAPEKGRANAELLKFLAGALGVPKRTLEVVSGDTSRTKRIAAATDDARGLVERLQKLCDNAK